MKLIIEIKKFGTVLSLNIVDIVHLLSSQSSKLLVVYLNCMAFSLLDLNTSKLAAHLRIVELIPLFDIEA